MISHTRGVTSQTAPAATDKPPRGQRPEGFGRTGPLPSLDRTRPAWAGYEIRRLTALETPQMWYRTFMMATSGTFLSTSWSHRAVWLWSRDSHQPWTTNSGRMTTTRSYPSSFFALAM